MARQGHGPKLELALALPNREAAMVSLRRWTGRDITVSLGKAVSPTREGHKRSLIPFRNQSATSSYCTSTNFRS